MTLPFLSVNLVCILFFLKGSLEIWSNSMIIRHLKDKIYAVGWLSRKSEFILFNNNYIKLIHISHAHTHFFKVLEFFKVSIGPVSFLCVYIYISIDICISTFHCLLLHIQHGILNISQGNIGIELRQLAQFHCLPMYWLYA